MFDVDMIRGMTAAELIKLINDIDRIKMTATAEINRRAMAASNDRQGFKPF